MRDFIEILIITSSAITCLMAIILLLTYLIRKPEELPSECLPAVTVFVPFFNEEQSVLIKTLDKLEQQDYPSRIQVLLIDDGSTNDASAAVLFWLKTTRKHRYAYLRREQNGGRKGYALDYALESGLAEGEIYVVVDSDTYIEPDGILELARKIWSDERYAAVCGYIVPENHQSSLLAKLQHYEHIGYYGAIRCAQDKLGMVPVLAGAFVAHRAEVVKKIGGWSEWLVEDIAWCWRAIAHQYRTGYAPRAVAKTQCPVTHSGLFNQRRRWARGRVEAFSAAWHVSPWSGVASTPWFLITTLQYIFPPGLLLIPVLIYLNILLPLVLGCFTLLIYLLLYQCYARHYRNQVTQTHRGLLSIAFATMLLELIVWFPNVLGYLDELMGKKKMWLTRS
ncbi:glycosyltransferase family 2 protein [Photobacterium sp. R1]